jgi:hypothetical protein
MFWDEDIKCTTVYIKNNAADLNLLLYKRHKLYDGTDSFILLEYPQDPMENLRGKDKLSF